MQIKLSQARMMPKEITPRGSFFIIITNNLTNNNLSRRVLVNFILKISRVEKKLFFTKIYSFLNKIYFAGLYFFFIFTLLFSNCPFLILSSFVKVAICVCENLKFSYC